MSIDVIRREIARALASRRPAYRGKLSRWKHRARGANLAQFEGLAQESVQAMEVMQHAGFVSGLPAGADLLAIPVGGKTVHTIVVASEFGAYKIAVGVGEVAIHHLTEPDCSVHLRSGGIVEIRGASKVLADTPLVQATGDMLVQGALHVVGNVTTDADIVAQGDISDHGDKSMAGMRDVFDGHVHAENDAGGPTDPPSEAMG